MNKQISYKQSIILQNKKSDANKLSDFIAKHTATLNVSTDIHHELRLAIEETFINIVSYAHTDKETHAVNIAISSTTDKISITFTDTGIAFNPLSDAAECKETDDHCEGGMGIHLIKSLTDYQQYNRAGQSNVFTLTKHYTKQNLKQTE